MQPLYTENEFQTARSRQLLPLRCLHCTATFHKTKRDIQEILNPRTHKTGDFCSIQCTNVHLNSPTIFICEQCLETFKKRSGRNKTVKHHFCSSSCAAKWNNAHKTKGTRISKLEVWLASKLPSLYPSLEFHFNRKDAINGELDIYVPTLKLAFELNGIFHYEPIYGPEKLASMQSNDHRKMLACAERGIELCVIDVSRQKYFKEQRALEFLPIITTIINSKLPGSSPATTAA